MRGIRNDLVRPGGDPRLLSTACNPDFHLDVYRPAVVAKGPPYLLSDSAPSKLGQRHQGLTGRAATTLKRSIIGIKGRQHEMATSAVRRTRVGTTNSPRTRRSYRARSRSDRPC